MTRKIQLSELCTNCLAADECSYRFNHTKPIIFCEEFLDTDSPESKNNFNMVSTKIESSINSSKKSICSNCENIEPCTLQKSGTHVTDCNEYS